MDQRIRSKIHPNFRINSINCGSLTPLMVWTVTVLSEAISVSIWLTSDKIAKVDAIFMASMEKGLRLPPIVESQPRKSSAVCKGSQREVLRYGCIVLVCLEGVFAEEDCLCFYVNMPACVK
jgi:hypothetical protein